MVAVSTNDKKKSKRRFWHFWECSRCSSPSEETRQQLLGAAFEEIHQCGFQAASINHILKRTGVTKGALYHHFPSKTSLGYAIVDELIHGQVKALWITPLQTGNPIDAIIHQINISAKQLTLEDIKLGCPLNNLAQEMAPIDEGFRQRIEAIYQEWRAALTAALERGQSNGDVRKNIEPSSMALMLIATLEGCIGMAKNAQSRDILLSCGGSLVQILEGLRASSETRGNFTK